INRAILIGHGADVTSIAYSPYGQFIASASGDGTVRIWDAQTGELSLILEIGDVWVRSVAYNANGRFIVV
ncbi:MAG TPA: hypothetical protein PLZ51_02310, partial [Aggregatilineales bacterium]|nr:hypothetical protein [Aggregatilineales bacterium]